MDIKTIEAAAEAVLFAAGEPVPTERLAQVLEVDRDTVDKLLSNMASRRSEDGSGLKLVRVENNWQLVTKAEFAPYIRQVLEIRRNTPLSQAAMEILAIVAYSQPVTHGYIDEVRGVDCSGTIGSLLQKGLIEERGRMDVPGKPIVYGTTLHFLQCFGLKSLSELPQLPAEEKGGEEPDGEPVLQEVQSTAE